MWAQQVAPTQREPALANDLTVLDEVDVDPIDGRLTFAHTDLSIGEGEYAFEVRRTYRPWGGDKANLGLHWVTPFDLHLDVDPKGQSASFVTEQGERLYFQRAGDAMIARTGPMARIETVKEGYALTGLGDDRTYVFDRAGFPLRWTGPSGYSLQYTYGEGHLLSQVTGPWGTIDLERDGKGRLAEVHTPTGTVRYERDLHGDLVRVVRDGRAQNFGYDEFGRLTSLADGQATVAYDTVGRVTALAGDALRGVELSYVDGEDEARVEVTRGGVAERFHVTDGGATIEHTDGDGLTTILQHDERDRLVKVTDPQGLVVTQRYDDAGRLAERAGPDGSVTYVYGSKLTSRPTELRYSDGRTVRFEFDLRGNLTQMVAPGGASTSYRYDGQGRLVEITDARGAVTTFVRDEHGYVLTATEEGVGTTRFHRNAAGQLTKVKQPDGRLVTVVREGDGRTMRVTDALGVVSEMAFDARGRLVRRVDEHGKRYRYTWSPRGDLQTVSDAGGLVLSFEYDAAGRVTQVTDAAGNASKLERPDARTLVVTDAAGAVRTLKRDAQGRLAQEVRGDQTIHYRYDDRGHLVERKTPTACRRSPTTPWAE